MGLVLMEISLVTLPNSYKTAIFSYMPKEPINTDKNCFLVISNLFPKYFNTKQLEKRIRTRTNQLANVLLSTLTSKMTILTTAGQVLGISEKPGFCKLQEQQRRASSFLLKRHFHRILEKR